LFLRVKSIDKGVWKSNLKCITIKLLLSEIQHLSSLSAGDRCVAPAGPLRLTADASNRDGRTTAASHEHNRRLVGWVDCPVGSPERGEFAGLGQIHQNGITESKSYDAASQLLANTHLNGSTPDTGHGYTLDSTGRRTAETFTDGTTPNRSYGYDLADQVTSANYGSGQIDAYAYDPAGNRSTATIASRGGSSTTYTANSANQYSTISGMSAPSHDSNGNLTSQNGVTYTWDSENRLLSVSDGVKKIENSYDGQHRRVLKRVLDLASSSLESELHYVYDGWNVIEESTLISSTATLVRTRTWGSDLSGSMQGAGGVGGLLLTEEIGTSTTAYHFQYDGNGNVTEITDLSGNRAASYRYDAFGNTLVATGSYAASNKYRFSTKPLDGEVTNAPLYYYAYRFYDPVTGRWPSRDPIQEGGGVNLYGFVGNEVLNQIDLLGCWVKLDSIVNGASNYDDVWDTLWNQGKIDDKVTSPKKQNAETSQSGKAKGKVAPKTKDNSTCYCIEITIQHTVDRVSINPNREGGWGYGDAGDFWGWAAHEISHVVALANRFNHITKEYNINAQPCFPNDKDAKLAMYRYEFEIQLFIDNHRSREADHLQEGYGTPKAGHTTPWNGTFPSIK
jgi:RHS repeat-associated protein